jgi:hypothetical protein
MKYQDKIRIFSQKQENQDIFKISGKNQESSVAAKPVSKNAVAGQRGGNVWQLPHKKSIFIPYFPTRLYFLIRFTVVSGQ